jgi:hypothetical protein
MTINPDEHPLPDDVPVDDAAEQQQPVDISIDDDGLDPHDVTDHLQNDADPADIIDQATIVAVPDEDRQDDTADW